MNRRVVAACIGASLAGSGGTPAHSAEEALYPAAQCAAYWLGRDDFARGSAYLDSDPTDPDRAAAFRAVAVRLNGGNAAPIDAFIATERDAMSPMVEAALYGDKISDRLQRRLLTICDTFAATQDETRDLR